MIHHMGMRVSNLEKSVEFYLKALAPINYKKLMAFEGVQAIGAGGMPDIWLSQAKPDEERKPVKDLHFAFTAANREQVDAFHAAALEGISAAGATCNGKPGPRPYTKTYYGAFVLDPEGNNLEVCHMEPGDGIIDETK